MPDSRSPAPASPCSRCSSSSQGSQGLAETAENAVVASYAPEEARGSAFGILAGIQSFANLAASAVAGALWTLVSPRAAFLYLAAWMLLAVTAVAWMRVTAVRNAG